MKTKTNVFYLLCSIVLFSCSNDDDNAPRPQAAFPVNIEYTSDVEPFVENLSINFEYNNQNNITLIETEDSANRVTSIQVSYLNGLVSEINFQNTFVSANYTFTYSNTNSGIISEILYTEDGTNVTIPVSYNNSSNAYTFNNDGDTYTLDLNADNYLEGISTPFVTYELFFNENETGPFVNVAPQPALYIVMMIAQPQKFYFFSPFEIIQWDTSVTREVINNRDADGNLNSVEYQNPDTGANMGRLAISYENRNL